MREKLPSSGCSDYPALSCGRKSGGSLKPSRESGWCTRASKSVWECRTRGGCCRECVFDGRCDQWCRKALREQSLPGKKNELSIVLGLAGRSVASVLTSVQWLFRSGCTPQAMENRRREPVATVVMNQGSQTSVSAGTERRCQGSGDMRNADQADDDCG